MTETNNPISNYDNIENIPLATLQTLFEALKTARVSPEALFAYAIALDAIDYAKEVAEEVNPEDRAEMTPYEALVEDCNMELEDHRDSIIDRFQISRECLRKMGYDVGSNEED